MGAMKRLAASAMVYGRCPIAALLTLKRAHANPQHHADRKAVALKNTDLGKGAWLATNSCW